MIGLTMRLRRVCAITAALSMLLFPASAAAGPSQSLETTCVAQLAAAASSTGQTETRAQEQQDCKSLAKAIAAMMHGLLALWAGACAGVLQSGQGGGVAAALLDTAVGTFCDLTTGGAGHTPAPPGVSGGNAPGAGPRGTQGAHPSALPRWTPTFTLPVIVSGGAYTLRVLGDGAAYAPLAGGSSNAPAAYLACALHTPLTCPLQAAVLASGASVAPAALQEPAIEGALDWGYALTQQQQAPESTGCRLLLQAARNEPMQSVGVTLVRWNNALTVIGPAIDAAAHLVAGGAPAQQAERSVHLLLDLVHGPAALADDTSLPSGAAGRLRMELVSAGLAPSASTYDPGTLLAGLASRFAADPTGAGTFLANLYQSAYGQPMSGSAKSVSGLFLSHFAKGLPGTAFGAAAATAVRFGQVWTAGLLTAKTTAGVAVTAGADALASSALPLVLDSAAEAIDTGYLIPLGSLLQTEVSLEQDAQSLCAQTGTLTQGGAADPAAGTAALGGKAVTDGLLAEWFATDAQLNEGEMRGAYTFADLESLDGGIQGPNARLFQRAASQEAQEVAFDTNSLPEVVGRAATATAALAQARLEAMDLAAKRPFDPARHPPVVLAVAPPCGTAPSAADLLAVTIVGVNLTSVRSIRFGAAAAPHFEPQNGDLALGSSIPAAHGMVDVRVTGPGGSSAATLGDEFTAGSEACTEIATAGQPPVLSAITPSTATAGSSVTLSGTGLGGATAVRFGNRAARFAVNADGTLTATVPDGSGTVQVRVTSPSGRSGACWSTALWCGSAFTYAPPVLTGVNPTSGPPGTEVTLTGSGLSAATAVRFGTTLTTDFRIDPGGSLSVVAPSVTGRVQVQVLTPSGPTGTCLNVYLFCGTAFSGGGG